MSDKEVQEKPLAAGPYSRINIEQTGAFSGEFVSRRHFNCIKYGGLSAAILIIVATVILILMLTVFHVRDPVLKMNSVNIMGLNNSTNFGPGQNLTVVADVSVKNPNVASFEFVNATTTLYYNGSIIGKTTSPSGRARARKTLIKEVLIEVMVEKMLQVGVWKRDLGRGILPISICMRIHGKVKITNAIKRSVFLNMDCTMNVNISSQGIQDQNCKRRVSL